MQLFWLPPGLKGGYRSQPYVNSVAWLYIVQRVQWEPFFQNLMGFRLRLKAICNEITFYFLQKNFKFAYCTRKNFHENFRTGYKKSKILCWFQVFRNGHKIMFRQKLVSQKHCKKCKIRVNLKFAWFWLLIFCLNFILSTFKRVWNQYTFCVFWYPKLLLIK